MTDLCFSHVAESTEGNGQGKQKGAYIGPSLTHFHAEKAEEMGEEKDERNEEQSTTCRRNKIGTDRLSDGLHHHIGGDNRRDERVGDNLPVECHCPYCHHLGVVTEKSDNRFGKNKADDGADGKEYGANFDAEEEPFTYSSVKFRSIAKSTQGLKSLSDAYDYRIDEERQTGDDRHGGNGSVTIEPCGMVEHDSGQTAQPLSGERRRAAKDDFLHEVSAEADISHLYADVLFPAAHAEQHEKAERLADQCGDGGTGDAQTKIENEQRGEESVEQHARENTAHSIRRIALEAHLVVERERGGHERRAQHYDTQVTLRVGQDGVCGTKGNGKRSDEQLPENGNYQAGDEAEDKSRGSHLLRQICFLGTQHPRDIVAGAMSEEKSHGLDDGHDGKGDTYCRRALRVDLSYKVRVDQIVQTRGQHADNRRDGHGEYHPMDGGMGEKRVVVSFHCYFFWYLSLYRLPKSCKNIFFLILLQLWARVKCNRVSRDVWLPS